MGKGRPKNSIILSRVIKNVFKCVSATANVIWMIFLSLKLDPVPGTTRLSSTFYLIFFAMSVGFHIKWNNSAELLSMKFCISQKAG